jgi:hypothetical protein
VKKPKNDKSKPKHTRPLLLFSVTVVAIVGILLISIHPSFFQSLQLESKKTYENDRYGIYIEYPSNATFQEQNFITVASKQIAHIFFNGMYTEPFLRLKIYSLMSNETASDEVISRIIKEKEASELAKNLNKTIETLNSEPAMLGGKAAQKSEFIEKYHVPSNNTEIKESKNLIIITLHNDEAYALEYRGNPQLYEKHLVQAERIIESFKINK